MTRILVTGGAGFMGSHLANYLVNQGHETHVADDLSGGYIENVDPQIEFEHLDLRDKEKTRKYVSAIRPNIIYHLAADAAEGRSQFTPIECTERNINGSINILIAAINNGLEKIVFTSSVAVYGDRKQKPPFSEEIEADPEDIYGSSKQLIERYIRILAHVHGFRWTLLRPHNVYGPNQNMADPYRNVLAIFMNCILKNTPFYIYGDGEQKRAFSYIGDQIPCIAQCGFNKNTDGQIINIGSAREYSVNELAGKILKASGTDMKPIYLPPRPQEVAEVFSTNDKAERLLGYKDKTSLEEGIRIMWEWAKQKGPQDAKYIDVEIESDKLPETWKKRLL